MKTYITLIIIAAVIISLVGFYLLFSTSSNSNYYEGLSLTLFSDYGLEQELKRSSIKDIEINVITNEDFILVPKIKELIDKALKEEFPLSREGSVLTDIDTLQSYHKYYANKLSYKYSTNPQDYVQITPADATTLEQYPNAYDYRFLGKFFEYNGDKYFWSDTIIVVNDDKRIDLEVYKLTRDLKSHEIWEVITDSDLEQMPLLKDALDMVEKNHENIRIQIGMNRAELTLYQKWQNLHMPSGFFEYEEKIFRLGSWIA